MQKLIHILLVDDDRGDQKLTSRALTASSPKSYKVVTACTLKDCFEKLEQQTFDVILLDLNLPDSNGLDTLIAVNKECSDIAIIVLTGLNDENTGIEAIRMGAQDYVTKGDGAKYVLKHAVRYAIERKQVEYSQKQYEKTLIKLNLELTNTLERVECANKQLEEFSHIVAHDVKGPIRTIGILTDWLISDGSDTLNTECLEYLHQLKAKSTHINSLADSINLYCDIGDSHNKTYVNCQELVKTIIKQYQPSSVSITVVNSLPCISCDSKQIQLLFDSLIKNAIEFSAVEKPLIQIDYREIEKGYQFSIRDNGPGIPECFHDKVFKIFQKLNPESQKLGFGLALAKRIIQVHQGEIWVESQEGQGTAVHFTIPQLRILSAIEQ